MNDLVIVVPKEIKDKKERQKINRYIDLGYRVEVHNVKVIKLMSKEKYERLSKMNIYK